MRLVHRQSSHKIGLLKKRPGFLRRNLVVFGLLFGAVGGYLLYKSFAQAPLNLPSTPTITVCGTRQPSDIEQYTGPQAGASPISTSAISGSPIGMGNGVFQLLPGSPDKWYIRDGSTTFHIYNATNGSPISTFTFPDQGIVGNAGQNFAVDPSGNVYVAGSTKIVKINPSGSVVWTRTVPSGQISYGGAYGYGSGANFRIGASEPSINGSYVWDVNGNPQPNNNVVGQQLHTNLATGDIMVGDNGSYVKIYSSDGMTQKFYMGTNLGPGGAGPFHFYVSGGVDELPDGRIIAPDGRGMDVFDANGGYLGAVKGDPGANSTNAIDNVDGGTQVIYYNGAVYYASGANYSFPQYLAKITLANVNTVLNMPQGTFHLGIGAGPFTNATDNYFPPGTTPQVFLQFYPWWAGHANGYSGSYTIRSAQQVLANQAGTPVGYNLNGLSSTQVTNLPVTLPSTAPGFYEMDVKLKNAQGAVVGADCLHYSIGAPGDTMDFSKIPGGGDANEIALSKQFGLRLLRGGAFKMSDLLPAGDPCVGSLNFSAGADANVQAAAAQASKDGVTYEIQLADGAQSEHTMVSEGCWQSRVTEVVNHYKAYIHAWEGWNEINNTYSGNGTQIANDILKPFIAGVRAADPSANIVAGSLLGVSTGTWQQICAAGGLDGATAIGDHPYTGHNRSFEEQGQIAQLQAVQAVLSSCGHGGMPIWNTEAGIWYSGPDSYYTQGDKIVRRDILQDAIGMTKSYNFMINGGFESWALLPGEVSPGSLASINFEHKINTRSFLRWIPTNIPHTYAAEYGSSGSDNSHEAVIWSDEYSVNAVPLLSGGGSATVTDEYGGVSTVTPHTVITLTGQVQYIDIPAGQTLSINPSEAYGSNLALSTTGATASATSHGSDNVPSNVIDGITDMGGRGNDGDGGVSIWTQHYTDTNPQLTITLPQTKTIDRVYVSSQDIASVQTGLRNFDVQVDDGSGSFQTVAQVRNQFFARNHLVTFAAQPVKQIRIANMQVNYSGYGDGLPPSFWPSDSGNLNQDNFWMGQDTVYEVEAYAPGTKNITKYGDINGDGVVDLTDLSTVLSNWGSPGIGDIDGDGTTGLVDLSTVLSNWTGD